MSNPGIKTDEDISCIRALAEADDGRIDVYQAWRLLEHAEAVSIELRRLQATERRWQATVKHSWRIVQYGPHFVVLPIAGDSVGDGLSAEAAVDAAIERLGGWGVRTNLEIILLRVVLANLTIPYWIGVFSGWYRSNTHASNSNPDSWIHGGMFLATAMLLLPIIRSLFKPRIGPRIALPAEGQALSNRMSDAGPEE